MSNDKFMLDMSVEQWDAEYSAVLSATELKSVDITLEGGATLSSISQKSKKITAIVYLQQVDLEEKTSVDVIVKDRVASITLRAKPETLNYFLETLWRDPRQKNGIFELTLLLDKADGEFKNSADLIKLKYQAAHASK